MSGVNDSNLDPACRQLPSPPLGCVALFLESLNATWASVLLVSHLVSLQQPRNATSTLLVFLTVLAG